jgi:hypothetical protein
MAAAAGWASVMMTGCGDGGVGEGEVLDAVMSGADGGDGGGGGGRAGEVAGVLVPGADGADGPRQSLRERDVRFGGDRGEQRGAEGTGIPGDAVDASGTRAAGGGGAVQEHRSAGRDGGEVLVGPACRAGIGG